MAMISVRLNTEDEEIIRAKMVLTGDTAISTFMRRVSLSTDSADSSGIGALNKQIENLIEGNRQQQKMIREILSHKNDGIELSMLASVFVMLYNSVDESIQHRVNKSIDIRAIESFLNKK
ncbi:hypothetical protein [Janthinobacterium sp. HH102]|uniref:hypothetical protein n=1 Tax=Janthinobacterium sp. HH102 TaxID=1537274 RepID=UPI0011130409|nr:hypothetical protein [Janthinobacterium sp. HH102]